MAAAPTLRPTLCATQAVATEADRLRDLAAALSVQDAARFYALLQQEQITAAEALELAWLAAPLYAASDDELPGERGADARNGRRWCWCTGRTAPDPLAALAWRAARRVARRGVWRGRRGRTRRRRRDWGIPIPRPIVARGPTVYQMKDRSGVVGAHGVGPLLRESLPAAAGERAGLHGAGHSYGCPCAALGVLAGATRGRARSIRCC